MATDVRTAATPPGTRRWRRFDVTVPVRVTVEKARQVSVMYSRVSQINAGGLAFLADTELAMGDEAEIALTDYDDLTLRGVVSNRQATSTA
jgi:hypothetical protein